MRPGKRQKLLKQRRRAIYHCWNRCVRRALLCGQDPYSGQDYSHRRDWILNRQEQLAALFAIEIGFHAEMSNHLHLVLRTRPDVARKWSRQEVAHRWLTITRLAKCMNDALPAPDPDKYLELIKDKKQIRKIRRRLSNVSWFMAILDENIARRANAEDECSGRFWQGRYKLRELEGFHSILLCGIYVDLNSEYWLAGVESYETGFCELVGTPAALSKAARESGRRCMKGASASQQIFTT